MTAAAPDHPIGWSLRSTNAGRAARRHPPARAAASRSSLFRCNDEAVFEELTGGGRLAAWRSKCWSPRAPRAARKKWRSCGARLEQTGATLHSYTDPVVKYHAKYLVADEGPAIVASLNFTKKCFKKTCDALVVTHDPAVVADLRRLWTADCARDADARRHRRSADHRPGARAAAVHRADRRRARPASA